MGLFDFVTKYIKNAVDSISNFVGTGGNKNKNGLHFKLINKPNEEENILNKI